MFRTGDQLAAQFLKYRNEITHRRLTQRANLQDYSDSMHQHLTQNLKCACTPSYRERERREGDRTIRHGGKNTSWFHLDNLAPLPWPWNYFWVVVKRGWCISMIRCWLFLDWHQVSGVLFVCFKSRVKLRRVITGDCINNTEPSQEATSECWSQFVS